MVGEAYGFYGATFPVAVTSSPGVCCNAGELGVLLFDFNTETTRKAGSFNFLVP